MTRSQPAASITAIASSAQNFGPITSNEGTRDERPIPRWSNRITRQKDARRRCKRYIDGSSSIASIEMDTPREHEQIGRAIAEYLIGDVQVATPRVASPGNLRYCHRLVHVARSWALLTLAGQREPAVGRLLDQPVDQQ